MKKLNAAVERFARSHPNFGIPNLMMYVVGANAIVYLLTVLAGYEAVSFLAFNWAAIKAGELWRLVTFALIPNSSGILTLIFLYFYYFIGSTLEREWGTVKFNIYFFSGILFTVVFGLLIYLIFGVNSHLAADYIYLN